MEMQSPQERIHAEGESLWKRGGLVTDLQLILGVEWRKVINKW